jgi:hypothetical protein
MLSFFLPLFYEINFRKMLFISGCGFVAAYIILLTPQKNAPKMIHL